MRWPQNSTDGGVTQEHKGTLRIKRGSVRSEGLPRSGLISLYAQVMTVVRTASKGLNNHTIGAGVAWQTLGAAKQAKHQHAVMTVVRTASKGRNTNTIGSGVAWQMLAACQTGNTVGCAPLI